MNSTQLAQVFEHAGRELESLGHLILVRRTRKFLSDGRIDLASAFLLEAKRRMPIDQVSQLCDAFGAWRRNEGDLDTLLGESDWIEATQRENLLSELLAQRTRDLGFSTLMNGMSSPRPPESQPETAALSEHVIQESEWEEEATSEIFEAQTRIFEMPEPSGIQPSEPENTLSDSLIVGVITMLFILTIYFCFFRSF